MSRQSNVEERVIGALRAVGIRFNAVAIVARDNEDGPNDDAYVEMHGESAASLTYDKLAALTVLLGTTDISFQWERGFCGSECTPSDPDEFTMVIRWKP